MNSYSAVRHAVMAVIAFVVLGVILGTPVFAGAQASSNTLQSWSSCTATLCIDAPPQGPNGLDGSGGWGWNNTANSPVKVLKVGKPANFTVTVLQPTSGPYIDQPGSIILTYSSQSFSLNGTSSRGATATNPFDRGGVAVFSYDADFFNHSDQSDSFTFTPQNAAGNAFVTATISVNGQQVSETFPVTIQK
jgi:hypothetical protein